eukprot:22617_1
MAHTILQASVFIISLSSNIYLSTSQNCYAQYDCYTGYMDKTEGTGFDGWECGYECPGRVYYTDIGCSCACIPESTCQPTASPTIPQPSVSPTNQPSQVPTLITALPTDSACYGQYECNDGYMDKTQGQGYDWACGSDCPGKIDYTDVGCSCACIQQGTCDTIDMYTTRFNDPDSDLDRYPYTTETINQKGSTWQFGSLFESIPFWAYIIAGVVLCCLLQICCKRCCKKRPEKVHYFPTATGVNNASQPQIHPKAAHYKIEQQVNHVIQPQQQIPVVFVTPQQNQLIFGSQHVQVPSHSIVNVPTDVPMQIIPTPQNNLIVNPSAPIQDDAPPSYNNVPPSLYEENPPAYEEINPEGEQDNNRQLETNC